MKVFYWTDKGTAQARPIYGCRDDSPINPNKVVLPASVTVLTNQLDVNTFNEQLYVVDTTTNPVSLKKRPDVRQYKVALEERKPLSQAMLRELVLALANGTDIKTTTIYQAVLDATARIEG